MPRYKTVFRFQCAKGHLNLGDEHSTGNSKGFAQNESLQRAKRVACKYCGGPSSGPIVSLGTEETSLYPVYLVRGYICQCGERVSVLRGEKDQQIEIPPNLAATCSEGHTRVLSNLDVLQLEFWDEQTN